MLGPPSFSNNPFSKLSLFSTSCRGVPRSRRAKASTKVLMSTNLRPFVSLVPRVSNSISAWCCNWRLASSADSVGLVFEGVKVGLRESKGRSGPGIIWYGTAVDDGEQVGLGCTTPICWRRWEKFPFTASGSMASTRISSAGVSGLRHAPGRVFLGYAYRGSCHSWDGSLDGIRL